MSGKTSLINNFKKPVVLIVGGVIGIVLILRNKSSAGMDPNYTQAMVTTHESDNELAARQMAIQAQTDQARINAENTKFLVSAGINADLAKTGIQASTAVALAGEQTKQLIGLGHIQANRDITINAQNTNRDYWVVENTNRANIINTRTIANANVQLGNMALHQSLSNNALQMKALDVEQLQIASNERLQANLAAANFTLASKQKNFSGGLGAGGVIAGGSQGSNKSGFGNILGGITGVIKAATPIVGMFA